MKTSYFLLLTICSFSIPLFSQNCNCPEQFEFLTKKIALNYAGYNDKVNPDTQADFDKHTGLYRLLTRNAPSDTTCLRMLSQWAAWFKDKHIQLGSKVLEESPEQIRARYANRETIALTEAEARALFDQPGRDSVEGIWADASGNYRVAVVKDSTGRRNFAAVVLKADSVWWMPGQVKFELKNTGMPGKFTMYYYMRDHSERNPAVMLEGNLLKVDELGNWTKIYPGTGEMPKPRQPQRYRLEKLDDQTLLMVVTTMNEQFRLELEKLVTDNKALLESTPNLIIDVRGNGGGSDITYKPLEKYLYTRPVVLDAMTIYCTEDNIDKFRLLSLDENFPKSARKSFGRAAKTMEKHKGEFYGDKEFYTVKYKKALPYPQKVAVLIDRGCGSSCEQFVLFAEQSKKVTLFGQNTAGILDYGNLHNMPFPCDLWTLWYPTSRSNRVAKGKGLDNTGFPPEVRLDETTGDWVEFAKEYLKEK